MPRYFIEVAYKGCRFNGFQVQQDKGITIQGEINRALGVFFKEEIQTTTSSRTDAGVHALQNFLHWDTQRNSLPPKTIYALNAILHPDLAIRNIFPVADTAHSRFDALSRKYAYHISSFKNPFKQDICFHYPFKLQEDLLAQTAELLKKHSDFTSFSKRNTDVKSFLCRIEESYWERLDEFNIVYHVCANRFLRGMVKALVGTQLQVARGKMSLSEFEQVILAKDCTRADFSPPSKGLFLEQVIYPEQLLGHALPHRQ